MYKRLDKKLVFYRLYDIIIKNINYFNEQKCKYFN